MEILSPKKIKVPPMTITVAHNSSFDYTDPVHGVPMTKSITTISMGQMGPNNPHLGFPNRPTEEQLKVFGGMQALIKSCVDNAEDIKDRLHNILKGKSLPKTEEERLKLMNMTFMKLKIWFINDIINTKKYKEFSVYNSTKKLSQFSKVFDIFVVDRNKYTHGQLCFLSPSFEYLLEYIDAPEQQKRYAYLDITTLKSYNTCFVEIRKVITEYTVADQNNLLKKHS